MGARLRRKPAPATVQTVRVAPPTGGINSMDPASAMPPTDSLYCYNLVAGELGLRSRLGYREWVTGLDGEVRSLLAFSGSKKNGSADRLFACTQTGIWDVSASTTTPTKVLTFTTSSSDSGWGTSSVMVTAAGHFLLYWDEENGYHVYSESGASWTKITLGAGAGQVNNVDPANLVAGCVWKNRVWMIERDSARAWYLDVASIYGAATSFNFGTKFRSGGPLLALANWTRDSVSGMDSRLVAVSTGGDVVVYAGTDPSSASTFGLVGTWFLGGVPNTRRLMTDYGGDLLILSTLGVMPMSKLVENAAIDRSQYATAKIANLFNVAATTGQLYRQWAIKMHPTDNTLLVCVPPAPNTATTQFAMSLATRSWSQYRDLPIYSAEVWSGQLYFGTTDGRVCVNTDYIDAVLLSNPNTFTPVNWSLLTAYQSLGDGRQKRVKLIRSNVATQGASPDYQTVAKFDFDFVELASSASTGTRAATAWDTSIWDTSLWSGGYAAGRSLSGQTGCGVDVAIAMRGTASARTTILGWDVVFDEGGIL